MMLKLAILLLLLNLVAPTIVEGGTSNMTERTRSLSPDAPTPRGSLADVTFLEGHWECEALGGTAHEVWSPVAGGAMMGMFRLITDDTPSFYEFFVLEEVEESLVLRIKHFDGRTLRGWEEQDQSIDFPLVAIEDNVLYLSGLTYQRTSDDRLDVFLAMHGKDGVQEVQFPFRRVAEGQSRAAATP